jgi:hypothetical protein
MLLLVLPVSKREVEIFLSPHVIVHYRHIATDRPNGLVCCKLRVLLFKKLSIIKNDFKYGSTSVSQLPNTGLELVHANTRTHKDMYTHTHI